MLASTNALRIDDLDLFADCTRAELEQISSLTTYLRIPSGQVLIREGSAAKEFIVIVSGSARVTRETDHGVVEVADVGKGDFLGEMALLTGSARTATATATTDLVVLVSSVGEFRSIMEIAPSVARKVRRASLVRASRLAMAA
jgi:CRP-like cAMP-binding protein